MGNKTVRFKNKSGDWKSKKLDRWEKAYQIQQKRSKRAVSIDNSRNANRFMNPANDKLSDKELRTYNSWVKNPARSDLVGIDTKTSVVGTSKTKIITKPSKIGGFTKKLTEQQEVTNFRGEPFKPEILEANIQAYIKQQQELKDEKQRIGLRIRDTKSKEYRKELQERVQEIERKIKFLGNLEVQDRERLIKIKGITPKTKIKPKKIKEANDPRFELENKPKKEIYPLDEEFKYTRILSKEIKDTKTTEELKKLREKYSYNINREKLSSSNRAKLDVEFNEKGILFWYTEPTKKKIEKQVISKKNPKKRVSNTKGKTREQIREDSLTKILLDKGLIKDKQEFNAKAYVDMNLSSVENRKDVLRKFGGTGKRKFTKEQDIKVPRKDAIEKFLSLPEKEREKDLKEQSKKVRNVPDLDWYNNPKKSDIQNIDTKNSNENKLRKELRGYKKTKTEINLKRFNQLDNKFKRTPKEEQEYNTLLRSFN